MKVSAAVATVISEPLGASLSREGEFTQGSWALSNSDHILGCCPQCRSPCDRCHSLWARNWTPARGSCLPCDVALLPVTLTLLRFHFCRHWATVWEGRCQDSSIAPSPPPS